MAIHCVSFCYSVITRQSLRWAKWTNVYKQINVTAAEMCRMNVDQDWVLIDKDATYVKIKQLYELYIWQAAHKKYATLIFRIDKNEKFDH